MAIPHLFCMDEIHVLQRICLHVFKKIALLLHLGVSHLKGKYHKKMTIKIWDMEIPIIVFGPLLWPNHFIVLNCVVLA